MTPIEKILDKIVKESLNTAYSISVEDYEIFIRAKAQEILALIPERICPYRFSTEEEHHCYLHKRNWTKEDVDNAHNQALAEVRRAMGG